MKKCHSLCAPSAAELATEINHFMDTHDVKSIHPYAGNSTHSHYAMIVWDDHK